MRKINHSKKNIAGLLIILVITIILLMIFVFLRNSNILDAKEQYQDKIMIKVNNSPVTEKNLEVDGNQAEVELATKKNIWVKIPLEKGFSISQVLENGQESSLPALSSDDFDIEDEVKSLESSETSKERDDKAVRNIPEIGNEDCSNDFTSIAFYTIEKNEEVVYVRLIRDLPIKFKVNRNNSSESIVKLIYLDEKNSSDTILKLASDEQFLAPVNLIPEEGIDTGEPDEFNKDELPDELRSDSFAGDYRAISISDPFKVSVDIDRLTGIAPFDTTDDPGYDSNPNNDRVRTFDSVNYTLRAGISTNTSTYKSLRVRVDTKVNGAWRLDSAGKVRQTAELLNGTLVSAANGTKNSTHSTWVNVEATSGQIFVTETLNTYGGVNNDEINPEFVLTIESAVTTTGLTVSINQVIDKSVSPNMSDKVYLSAKPYVEVKLTRNTTKNSTFEKVTGISDKPYSLITPVASFVQLKPLPGRSDLTSLKGTTYPVGGIEYKINQKIIYTNQANNVSKELLIGKETDPVQVIIFDGFSEISMPKKKFTAEYSDYSTIYKPLSLQGTRAPFGYTKQVYPPNQVYSNRIGIYDTGNPEVKNNASNFNIEISNQDYTPISVGKNKWYFSGSAMESNTEPFSVTAMQMRFPYEYLEKQVGTNSTLKYELTVSSIKYEGVEQIQSTKETILWDRKWPGNITPYATFLNEKSQPLSSVTIDNTWSSDGDGSSTIGNKIYANFTTSITDVEAENIINYGRWNANSFAFDFSRPIKETSTTKVVGYGVNKSNIPDLKLRSQEQLENAYDWYSSANEAEKHGEISAIKSVSPIAATTIDGYQVNMSFIPLVVIGSIEGTEDKNGASNIAVSNSFTNKPDGNLSLQFPTTKTIDYKPTQYLSNGSIVAHNPNRHWGDTLYIRGVLVRPTISTNKSNYNPTEKITWTAKGSVTSGSDQNHKVQLDVTIPKETIYEFGSATNHKGEAIPNPTITENSDGTKTLRFIQDYLVAGNYNSTVNFNTAIVSSALNFMNNQATLSAKVVSQVWLEQDSSVTDTSSVAQRTSNTSVTVSNAGVIVIDKITDEPFIESGNKIDPANQDKKNPSDITYTISYKNHSTGSLGNVRALDVLPYNGDGRGTKYSGSYTVINTTALVGKGDFWYTDTNVSVDLDPNSVNLSDGKWKKLGNDQSALSKAKAIMAVYSALPPGENFSYSVTLRPIGQKAGDQFSNSPTLNSNLNQLVNGVVSSSSVLGRELSGIAWYDDDLDGLIGKAEKKVPNVPVKLYRTSQINNKYKEELVKESLTGELFIDASNNSLIKTNDQGEYVFKNLPEGEYVVEFAISDQLQKKKVLITKRMIGDDQRVNSKANVETAKTDDYIQPILSELPDLVNDQSLYQLENINIGLIRPSKVSLFKYIAGTAKDTNGDGILSDEEKAKGSPLKNAEFVLYEADSDKEIEKATTDATGLITFDGLFPGKYYLVETKSPEGYELIKKKVFFEITKGNQTIQIYQDDSASTKLPFTGSDKMFLFLIITSSSLILFGLVMIIFKSNAQKGRQA